jgi:hypothetical protein
MGYYWLIYGLSMDHLPVKPERMMHLHPERIALPSKPVMPMTKAIGSTMGAYSPCPG